MKMTDANIILDRDEIKCVLFDFNVIPERLVNVLKIANDFVRNILTAMYVAGHIRPSTFTFNDDKVKIVSRIIIIIVHVSNACTSSAVDDHKAYECHTLRTSQVPKSSSTNNNKKICTYKLLNRWTSQRLITS